MVNQTVSLDQSFFKRSATRMHENGFSPRPIVPKEKRPAVMNWSEPATIDQIESWTESHSNCGVGMVCGNIVGIDIDIVDDPALAMRIDQLARKMLGDTPLTRIGRAPKRMLVYRCSKPFKTFKMHPLEVLAEGSQFVAYGIHPDTQKPYTWPVETPDDTDVSELPEITEEQAREWATEAFKLVPAPMRPQRLAGAPDGSQHVSSGDLEGDYEAIKDALGCIPNHDLPYDDWISIGMGIKGALGDAGQGLFDDWSDQSQKNITEGTDKAWRSLRPHSKGAGSIYYQAQRNGWVPSDELDLNPHKRKIRENPVDFSGLMKGGTGTVVAAAENIEPEARNEFPFHHIENRSGLLRELYDEIIKSAPRIQPVLTFYAVIAALGTFYGRRYQLLPEGGLSNVFIVLIAPTGAGKDHPQACIKAIFTKAGIDHLLSADEFASARAINTAIEGSFVQLAIIDEFGMMLQATTTGNVAPHLRGMVPAFLRLYSASNGQYRGVGYADPNNLRPPKVLERPCFSFVGFSTPTTFYDALSSSNKDDGFLGRILLGKAPDDVPYLNPDRKAFIPPSETVARLKYEYETHGHGDPDSNLSSLGNEPGLTDSVAWAPVPVNTTEEVIDACAQLDRYQTDIKNSNAAGADLYGRMTENVMKIAMILAISDEPERPLVELRHFSQARDLVEYSVKEMVLGVQNNVADSSYQIDLNLVLGVIREADADGIPLKEVSRRTKKLDRHRRTSILAHLEEMEEVVCVAIKTAGRGRPPLRYFHIDYLAIAHDLAAKQQSTEQSEGKK